MIRRVICITGQMAQPRVLKRVNMLRDAGLEVVVVGYDRGIYTCNKLPEDIEVRYMGTQKDDSGYINKITQGYRDVKSIVAEFNDEETVFYSFSIMTAVWFLLRRVKYFYEISDIQYGYNKMRIIQPILKFLDRFLIKKSALTVMTSLGFYRYFYGDKKVKNVIVQPNKVNSKLTQCKRCVVSPNMAQLRFSFVGSIRYFNTVLRFAKVVGKYYPQHLFNFYGDSSFVDAFKAECREYPNVIFHGSFKNPGDLEEIYSNTDVVIACYENENLNERIAEPNKMYEAMLFCKPIVVSQNTFLATQIESYKCGYVINAYSDADICSFIDNLNEQKMIEISKHELCIPEIELKDSPRAISDFILSM